MGPRISATVFKERTATAPTKPGPDPLPDTVSYVADIQRRGAREQRSARVSGSTLLELGDRLRPFAQEAQGGFTLKFYTKGVARGESAENQEREPLRASEIPPLLESITKAGI